MKVIPFDQTICIYMDLDITVLFYVFTSISCTGFFTIININIISSFLSEIPLSLPPKHKILKKTVDYKADSSKTVSDSIFTGFQMYFNLILVYFILKD